MIKTYSEMIKLPTFEERFNYLKLNGVVSELTFGYNRYLNQSFYHSPEWRKFRRGIIIRDNGCDLACQDREIRTHIYIHHLNPITVGDLLDRMLCALDPENAVCVSRQTHNAIHYGDESQIVKSSIVKRTKDDTCPWR